MINWFKNYFKKDIVFEEDNQEIAQPCIVWIHGANQSSLSFSYIKSQLPQYRSISIDYSSNIPFYENLEQIVKRLKHEGPVFPIGHSLGGIYALHLLKHVEVVGGISISTPFRGSSTADWARFIIPSYQIFKDVGRKSKPIVELNDIDINVPWTQIVSTTGSVPYHNGPNDGVVTVASMMHFSESMECIEVENTHYEVMCSDDVVKIIDSRYKNVLLM